MLWIFEKTIFLSYSCSFLGIRILINNSQIICQQKYSNIRTDEHVFQNKIDIYKNKYLTILFAYLYIVLKS